MLHELLAVDTVTITKQVSRRRIIRERLNELPGGLGCCGMVGDVEVDEFTTLVTKDHEREQQAEGEGRDDEEVDGDDVSGMCGQERAPGR